MNTVFGLIVEGHGDVEGVPALVRNHFARVGIFAQVLKPMRVPRTKVAPRFNDVENAVRFLALKEAERILLVMDADDDCPVELSENLAARMGKVSGSSTTVAAVMACREFEGWFLAGLESLRGSRGIPMDASFGGDCEKIRGAKEVLTALMPSGISYSETVDQPALASVLDTQTARSRSRSLDKFLRTIEVFASS